MSQTTKRTFSLPPEHAAFIDAKVESGRYASASEVVRAGLRALRDRDEAVERWLREEVAPSHDALKEGRAGTVSSGEVMKNLRARHKSRTDRS